MSHSMKTFLLFQVSLVLCVLSQSTQFYIDQSTSTLLSQQDGSQQNPFSSLAAAFKAATSKSAEIIFMGESYTVNSKEAFNTGSRKQIVLTVKAPEGFVLHFEDPGQIICNNYAQYINEDPVKNVNISFSGITIDGNSSKAMFYGSCYFRFENIYIDELPTTFLTTTNEGSALLRNFTINDIRLRDDQNLIDQDSRQRIEADYLILDSVSMKNTRANSKGEVYAVIMSNLQYSLIQVKDSELMGIGFKIKGEQIGGNNKTDIYMSNSVMSNAENFFFIESYGTVLIEDSVFTNASNRAVFFFLVDENLSPILGTFKNCLFSNNAVRFAGGALTYQGSKETNYQLFMNAIITGCSFINNAASFSGGALALLFFQNANVTVENSNFSSNTAVEAGGAIYVDKGESTLIMTIRNSAFDSNSAFSGGVFSFDFLNGAQIILENNVYTRNSAKLEGGIGYVSESSLTLTDTNSYASSNKAHFQAGAWSLESDSNVTFQNVSFTETKAFLRGGCITNSGASLTLNQTSFSNCTLSAVASAGGALFVGQDAVVKVYNSDFTNNLAEFGASFSIQSTRKESQVFDGITISSELKRISKDAPTIKSQICSGPGDLTLQSMVVPSLQSPFLLQQEGKVLIQNVVLQDITCDAQDDSLYFCLFDVQQTDSALTVENFELGNASSSVPLLVSRGGSASLTSVKIDQMSMPSDVAVWDIRDSVLKVQNMEINSLDKNFVRSVNSDMSVENSNFETQGRGTASDTGEQASNEYDLVAKSR